MMAEVEERLDRLEEKVARMAENTIPRIWVEIGQLKVKVGVIWTIAGTVGGVVGGAIMKFVG